MLTIKFNNVYIDNTYSITGKDEYKGNIKHINEYIKDYFYGEKTIEECEMKMQDRVIMKLINNNYPDIIIGSDLSNQLGLINKTMTNYHIPFIGIYSACSSFILSIIISGILINNKNINNSIVITSSHSLSAEKQFRFPNEYANIKSPYQTNTITCSIGANITNKETKFKIVSGMIGEVVDYKIKDAKNMGAIMAPACAKIINDYLKQNQKNINDYDLILTGDLGILGLKILKDLLKSLYRIESNNIIDSGAIIYKKNQNKCCGGSGPSVLPLVLFNNVFNSKKYKKILVIGTGSLHNRETVNLHMTIPSIAHLIEVRIDV